MKKIKRLIVTLIFPKTVAFIAIVLGFLIIMTLLEFIPVILGWALTVVFISIIAAFLACIIFNPIFVMHAVIWCLNHTVYKIKTVDHQNIPLTGGGLLVSNSVSYIDHIIIFSAIKRPVKFFVGKEFRENPFLQPFLDSTNSIPIDYNPKTIGTALNQARRSIQNGELVCIFAEGELTKTGHMLPFKRGFEFIMRDLSAPIIPIHLDRIWGSTFSFVNGKLKWRFPKVIPYPITVSVGKPMPASAQAYQVRLAVQELSADAFKLRGDSQKKLHIGFINEMRRHPFKFLYGDLNSKLSFIKVFTAAAAMSRRLGTSKENGEMIGVILPTTIAGCIVNIAALFAGKIPVNLNFTSSKETLESCVAQCGIKQIVTSRAFVDKLNFHDLDRMSVFVEDISKEIKTTEKFKILVSALIFPAKILIKKYVKGDTKNIDDLLTVVFSSGSEGEPKGIMLTHQNIVSNIEAAYKIVNLSGADVVAGILPLFHSFGYTVSVWLCAYYGIGAALHTSSMEAQKIGELVEKYKCTLLVSTPTFLNSYARKCTKEQFASLRIVVAGAEKLQKSVSKTFYEKFQKEIYEGYGATELSPIVSVGTPSYIDLKTKKIHNGNKFGTVGHPMPGVAAKIVDPETFELMPFGREGMLLIKGPNVMKGYLNDPVKTAQVIKDGWYITGDIAAIDEEGFIAITDRLSRFSKIGGEMVPQIKVEEAIHEASGMQESFAVVTSVPDEKKGERLAVLYTGQRDIAAIIAKLKEKKIPNLWVPKQENFYQVESFPLLGSGKVDIKQLKKTALEFSGAKK
ncbi:AMP-binding protein [Endomicrobium proavitum]|uniref:AMP-binding protein n=1 Tax=Endomicrobium proavitum TaxID=1408281 RepID=UPI000697B63D|nr:AMP-binding protein [Endomicrobium proavitum]